MKSATDIGRLIALIRLVSFIIKTNHQISTISVAQSEACFDDLCFAFRRHRLRTNARAISLTA